MLRKPIILVGASGHSRSLLSLIGRQDKFKPIGLVDSHQVIGSIVNGLPILGREEDAAAVCRSNDVQHVFVAVGHNSQRQRLASQLSEDLPGIVFPVLVDPSAVVAADVRIGAGVAVMALAHVGPGSVLADGTLINTAASLDHDCHFNSFASLAPGVIAGGSVHVGARSAICLGARLVHRITIGADTVVGAGSLVLKDLPSGVLAYGSPARVIRLRDPGDPYL